MSKPLGSTLDGTFFFERDGVLADPSPLPTITVNAKPGGIAVAPPVLTHPSVGVFYAAQLFSALDTASLTGFYTSIATTSDDTVDNPQWFVGWEVEVNNVTQIEGVDATDAIKAATEAGLTTQGYTPSRADYLDALATNGAAIVTAIFDSLITTFTTVGSFGKLIVDNINATIASRLAPTTPGRTLDVSATGEAGIDWANIGSPDTVVDLSETTIKSVAEGSSITVEDIWNAQNADYTDPGSQSALLASIKSDTSKITEGTIIVNEPVDPDTGLTTLVRGSSYMLNDSRSVSYTIESFPDLPIGEPAFWHAQKLNRGGAETVEGEITAAKVVRFEFTAAQTLYLASGNYSLSLDSENENPLRTPNNTLIILES